MTTLVESLEPREVCASPAAKPLDEAVWQAWIAKDRAEDWRSSAVRMTAVRWVAIAALLAAAALWSYVMPYEVLVRFVVVVGAMVAMFQALHPRHLIFAGIFGALLVLYNPVVPVFSFSGGWQRAVVVASAVPFTVSFRLARLDDGGQ